MNGSLRTAIQIDFAASATNDNDLLGIGNQKRLLALRAGVDDNFKSVISADESGRTILRPGGRAAAIPVVLPEVAAWSDVELDPARW